MDVIEDAAVNAQGTPLLNRLFLQGVLFHRIKLSFGVVIGSVRDLASCLIFLAVVVFAN